MIRINHFNSEDLDSSIISEVQFIMTCKVLSPSMDFLQISNHPLAFPF
jgi:hypothetical protein